MQSRRLAPCSRVQDCDGLQCPQQWSPARSLPVHPSAPNQFSTPVPPFAFLASFADFTLASAVDKEFVNVIVLPVHVLISTPTPSVSSTTAPSSAVEKISAPTDR